MDRPLLIDLYSGDGGAGEGYRRAGFQVIGVDIEHHPYPAGEFHRADAIAVLAALAATGEVFGHRPAVVHASPPCHDHSDLSSRTGQDGTGELLVRTRELLAAWGGPYVIENVEGAPLEAPLQLCGSEFGLAARCRDGRTRQLRRHRLFESNVWLMGAGGCGHRGQPVGVYGNTGGTSVRGYKGTREECAEAMGIHWMRHEDVAQAIPPAYTEFIGEQLLAALAA